MRLSHMIKFKLIQFYFYEVVVVNRGELFCHVCNDTCTVVQQWYNKFLFSFIHNTKSYFFHRYSQKQQVQLLVVSYRLLKC